MNRSSSRMLSFLLAAGLFIAGIAIGSLLWNRIFLPFENPWGVTGPLTFISFNPANNVIRFLVFVSCPLLLLGAAYLLSARRAKEALFAAPAEASITGRGGLALFLFLVLFSTLVALNYPFNSYDESLDTFHEGESIGTSVSHEAGHVPYRDYIFAHGLYQDPLRSVVAFKLFGKSIAAARALENVHKVMAFALLAVLAWALFARNFAYAFAALAMSAVYVYYKPSAFFIAPSFPPREKIVFLFLLSVVWLDRCARKDKPGAAVFVPGFLFSFIPIAALAHSIDRGFYLLATAAALAPFIYLFMFRANRVFILSVLLGAASGTALLLVLLRGGVFEFFSFAFMTLPRYKELMDGLAYPFWRWSAFIVLALAALNSFWLLKRFLGQLRISGKAALPVFFRGHVVELALLLLSLAVFRGALGRADYPHISYNVFFTYLLTLYLIIKHAASGLVEKAGGAKAAGRAALAIAVVLSISLSYRVYGGRLMEKNFPLHLSDAELIPDNYKAAISFLDENLGPGEHFFTMTSEAAWYYFLERPSPTRFPIVWFAMPHFYQQEIVEDLEEKNVKYILMSNAHWANRIDRVSSKARLPIVRDHIHVNYAPLGMIDDHEIWVRKGLDATSSGAEQ